MIFEIENAIVELNLDENQVNFSGSLRLNGVAEYEPILKILEESIEQAKSSSSLILDLQALDFLNSSGISILSKFVIKVRNQKNINLTILGSQKIPWQGKSLKNLQRLMPNLILEIR